jgi:DNA-binding response OmpR family regulator
MARRILVIDDEPRWRTVFQAALSEAGMEVDAVAGTAQAAELLRHRQYGLILLDVVLGPGNNTLECQLFLDAVARGHPSIPIVAATGKHLEPPDVAAICRYGVVEFLYKPRIRLPELRQLVKDVLDRDQRALARAGLPDEAPAVRYDAFVSYSRRDLAWVAETLVPELDGAGLAICVDYRDFEPGAHSLAEMERCVLESRCTVLVLSPDYVASEWTGLEDLLVQTLDPSARMRRTLPVMRQQCVPPLRVRALTYVDLTSDPASPTELARLVAAIRRQR